MRKVEVIIVGGSLSAAACAFYCRQAGLEVLVLEKKKLPRHKICSGILSPRGHHFLKEHFGEIPEQALHRPKTCRGVNFLFPDASQMPMDFLEGPTPHLHRKFSDHWAIRNSGALVEDAVELVEFHLRDSEVFLKVKQGGKMREYLCRVLVGADGPRSTVVEGLYPGYRKHLTWFFVLQKYYKARSALSEDYFHFLIDSRLGHYPWTHVESGQWIVGAGGFQQDDMKERHRRVLESLRERHGLEIEEEIRKEGCPENFGLSLTNRYVFGRASVLVTGQAAGFLNMMAEGMSCALHSGAHAGRAIAEALEKGGDLQEIYRRRVRAEVIRCSDQWNLLKILLGNPHEADLKKALFREGPARALYRSRELLRFARQFSGLGWGKDMFRAALRRVLIGNYGEPFSGIPRKELPLE
jgi:flavin-dependent dehydrogenase